MKPYIKLIAALLIGLSLGFFIPEPWNHKHKRDINMREMMGRNHFGERPQMNRARWERPQLSETEKQSIDSLKSLFNPETPESNREIRKQIFQIIKESDKYNKK